jgi:uncharacterized protein (TIGR04255 family)
MVARGTPLPAKIEPDAILEAIFELRFDAALSLPEVLFGRLAEMPAWQGFTQRRMPAYELPAAFREADPNLRFVPVFELAPADGRRAVRVGAHVISYHCLAPYVGWDAFCAGFSVAVDGLFAKAEHVTVHRLGLRYINAVTQAAHGIRSIADLDLNVCVAQERLTDRLNLNLTTDAGPDSQCTIRVATREFVLGSTVADAAAFIDVDVATRDGFRTEDVDAVKRWVAAARRTKNQAFLCLLTAETLQRLGRPA